MIGYLLDFLNPVSFWKNTVSCYRDVVNYSFYRGIVKKLDQEGLLKEKGMRTDWLKRVYFVINLQPETLLAGQDIDLLERSRVTEAIAERNQVFMKDGLLEIIQADYQRIKTTDYYAYLIWVKYRWTSSIATWLKSLIWLTGVITLCVNYQLFIQWGFQLKDWYVQINN